MPPAVFLDRDDTLIACRSIVPGGDLGDPALVRLLPTVAEACRRLKNAGYLLVVVSNQGGVARARYTEADVHAVNSELNRQLGALIDRFYFCPFHPEGVVPAYRREHPWRRPAPGMLLQAAADLRLNLKECWMLGDQERDIRAAQAAGCRSILISDDPRWSDAPPAGAEDCVPTLAAAAALILMTDVLNALPSTIAEPSDSPDPFNPELDPSRRRPDRP